MKSYTDAGVLGRLMAVIWLTAQAGCGGAGTNETPPSASAKGLLETELDRLAEVRQKLESAHTEAVSRADSEKRDFCALCDKLGWDPVKLIKDFPTNVRDYGPLFEMREIRKRWDLWERRKDKLEDERQMLSATMAWLKTAIAHQEAAGPPDEMDNLRRLIDLTLLIPGLSLEQQDEMVFLIKRHQLQSEETPLADQFQTRQLRGAIEHVKQRNQRVCQPSPKPSSEPDSPTPKTKKHKTTLELVLEWTEGRD
jgi:hypothetical protein